MVERIIDGRARFDCSLSEFYQQDEMRRLLARKGLKVPRTSDVAADADPVPARVNPLPDGTVRWIAVCPACLSYGRTAAEYVWLESLLFFCVRCGNAAAGGRWLRVELPAERVAIEKALLARPDPSLRAWEPGESVADLRTQNAALKREKGAAE